MGLVERGGLWPKFDCQASRDECLNFACEFNAEITYGALDLDMTQQELDSAKVAGVSVELRDFGSAQRMGAVV